MKVFYYLFIFRYFKDNFPRTILSIIAISLGIALFVSTQINAWRAEKSVLDQMIGYSSEKFIGRYVANNQNQGANDTFLKEIDSHIPENIKLEPEFQTKGILNLTQGQILSFPLIGKDILLSFQVFPTKEEKKKIPKYFISQSLYEKLPIQEETTKLLICEKEIIVSKEDYQVIPTDGIFLLMDITRLQSICNQKNQITSIWLIQDQNFSEVQSIQKLKSTDWTYEPKELILERAGIVLGSLKINLTIVSLVSVLISFFMVSNMFTGLYLSRKREFGILLSIGTDKTDNFILFLAQSVLIGTLGGIVGILLGIFIANSNLFTTVNTITDSNQIRSYRNIPLFIIFSGFLISIIGSVIASLYNSYKTYQILPIDLIRERDLPKTDLTLGFSIRKTLLLSTLFIILGTTIGLVSFAKQILPGMIGIGFVILGFVSLNFLAIPYFVYILEKTFSKFHFPQSIKIGLKEIQMEPWKHGLTASTIMLSTSLVFTLTSLTSSYESSLIRWVDEENQSDYSLINEKKLNSGEPGVPVSLYETLLTNPNFSSVEPFYIDSKFIVNGKYYTLHVLNFKNNYDKNQLIVSKNLCFLDQICKGNSITINTELNSQVNVIVQDEKDHFFSERGTIMMDYSFFQKNFMIKYLNSIRITKNNKIPNENILRQLQDITQQYDLKFINQSELKKLYLEGMNQVFSILDTLKISALFISILALTTSLIYFIREKSQLLAGLKAIGMDSYQMFQMIYTQTLFLISFGIFSGIFSSLVLSPIVIFGINRNAFGWVLDFQYPMTLVVKLPIFIPVITFLICLLPFYFLKYMNISKELKYE
ncbi:ABC transporter permease [Leptospira sp. 85282-16]|uniref:ABC transporter permease n=1 Tax=Leptospira montravelensis TaxID=2484961 RepID=A0ABY2LU69_9LEPT|nr:MULTISPECIES: ABC transporter permease [Leptospira]MCT8334910.1 ABC transporter permease [Leptospira sp. 85282-16]TGK78828.1 ABC transporter permease [Leptospira montravelensis]TGL02529.1 ABC transporter permease [Leptospira montravelensis]